MEADWKKSNTSWRQDKHQENGTANALVFTGNTTSLEQNGTSTDLYVITGYHVFIGFLFILISLVGTIGNTLVLVVVKKKPSMRTTTNLLLASLAIADLVSLLGLLPKVFYSYVGHSFPDEQDNRFTCMFLTAGNISAVSLAVSILTLAILAYERYMALLRPMREQWRLNQENVNYAIISTWVIPMILTVPYFLRTTYSQSQAGCLHRWASHTEQLIYLTTILIFLFITPYSVITFCYFSIIKGIYFTNVICPIDTGNTEADARSKKRVVEVLLMVTLSFSILVGTFALVNTLREIGIVEEKSVVFHLAGALLFLHSSINPIIYAFRSSNYKTAFKEIVTGRLTGQA